MYHFLLMLPEPQSTTLVVLVSLQTDDIRHIKPRFHLGTLSLTDLEYRFGNYNSAALALQETIRMAQATGDSICLARALVRLWGIAAIITGE
jgi:hypothetical protein